MEIVFTILLLVVPVFSFIAFALSLIAYKKTQGLGKLMTAVLQVVRGDAVSPIDEAIDAYKLGGI